MSQGLATKSVDGAKVFYPSDWPVDSSFRWYKSQKHASSAGPSAKDSPAAAGSSGPDTGWEDADSLEMSSAQDSLLLMKFFSLSSAVASALCWCKGGSTLELLFKLNSEETRIVEYGRWAFPAAV